MTAPGSPSFAPNGAMIHALVERGLGRYRPVTPANAVRHFRQVATFLLETHPAAFRWLDGLQESEPFPEAGAANVSDDALRALAAALGLRPRSIAEIEDLTEVVLHQAESGLRFLVDASFPLIETRDERRRALDRFVDRALTSLFAGLLAAIFRAFEADPKGHETGRITAHFIWTVVLFRRFELRGRDARTFDAYFMHTASARKIAMQLGTSVGEEQEQVLRFLDRFGAFVGEEAPRVEREVKLDPLELTQRSKPWALALLKDEIQNGPRRSSKRRRGS